MNGNTCLANLTVVIQPTSIYSGTRTTNLTMQHLSELEQLVEVLLRTHTITTGNNDGSTLQVMLSSLNVVVEHLYYESLRAYILAYLWVNNLLAALAIVQSLLHYARAYSCHLWTVAQKILSVKKDGGDVDAITASTITSRAYALAVKNAVEAFATIQGE